MVLRFLNLLEETSFDDKKKYIFMKTWTLHERKVHIKTRERVYDSSDKEKVDIMDSWE